MASTLHNTVGIWPAEPLSYSSAIRLECSLHWPANWLLTLTMHSMRFVVIAFAGEDAMEMVVVVVAAAVVAYVDVDAMLVHLKWAMVMDRVVSVGSVEALFYDCDSPI